MAVEKPFIRVKDRKTRHVFDVHRQAFNPEKHEPVKDVPDSWAARPAVPHIKVSAKADKGSSPTVSAS